MINGIISSSSGRKVRIDSGTDSIAIGSGAGTLFNADDDIADIVSKMEFLIGKDERNTNTFRFNTSYICL